MLLGNGNGTFQTKQTFVTGIDPECILVSDLNGDGKMDLVSADSGSNVASCSATGMEPFRPGSPSASETLRVQLLWPTSTATV